MKVKTLTVEFAVDLGNDLHWGKVHNPLFVTGRRCIPVKNKSG